MTPHVVLTSIIHLFAAFSLIFCTSFVILGWLLSIESCFYVALTLLAASIFALVFFRLRPPARSRLEAFKGAGWPSENIAHRGGATEAPENTLTAFREARKNGAKFVEFDIALTKDGVPVILHDDTVERTTDGTGAINHLTLAEVSRLNSAAKHPLRDQFPHAAIPTLEEATVECLSLGLNIFFDVKDWSDQMVNALTDLFKRHPVLYERGMVCSFFPQTSYKVHRKDQEILVALITCNHSVQYGFGCDVTGPLWKRCLCILGDYLLMWSQSAWLWFLCGNAATLLDKCMVSQETVDYWAQRGIETIVWTVNDKTEKEYFNKCLQCGVITDTSMSQCDMRVPSDFHEVPDAFQHCPLASVL